MEATVDVDENLQVRLRKKKVKIEMLYRTVNEAVVRTCRLFLQDTQLNYCRELLHVYAWLDTSILYLLCMSSIPLMRPSIMISI